MTTPSAPTAPGGRRRRIRAAAALPVIVAAGLASRRIAVVGAVLGKYPGDALWTVMAYALVVVLWPGLSRARVAALAFGVSAAVECSQLLQWPWLLSLRETTLGRLALGTTFHPPDFVAYATGAAMAWAVDAWMARRPPVLAFPPRP